MRFNRGSNYKILSSVKIMNGLRGLRVPSHVFQGTPLATVPALGNFNKISKSIILLAFGKSSASARMSTLRSELFTGTVRGDKLTTPDIYVATKRWLVISGRYNHVISKNK